MTGPGGGGKQEDREIRVWRFFLFFCRSEGVSRAVRDSREWRLCARARLLATAQTVELICKFLLSWFRPGQNHWLKTHLFRLPLAFGSVRSCRRADRGAAMARTHAALGHAHA